MAGLREQIADLADVMKNTEVARVRRFDKKCSIDEFSMKMMK